MRRSSSVQRGGDRSSYPYPGSEHGPGVGEATRRAPTALARRRAPCESRTVGRRGAGSLIAGPIDRPVRGVLLRSDAWQSPMQRDGPAFGLPVVRAAWLLIFPPVGTRVRPPKARQSDGQSPTLSAIPFEALFGGVTTQGGVGDRKTIRVLRRAGSPLDHATVSPQG